MLVNMLYTNLNTEHMAKVHTEQTPLHVKVFTAHSYRLVHYYDGG